MATNKYKFIWIWLRKDGKNHHTLDEVLARIRAERLTYAF